MKCILNNFVSLKEGSLDFYKFKGSEENITYDKSSQIKFQIFDNENEYKKATSGW